MIEQVKELDPATLTTLVRLENQAFGVGGLNEWHYVPLARHGRVFIFREHEAVVGSVQYMLDWEKPKTAYIVGIVVDEALRGRGIATQLLQASFEKLREEELEGVELTVAPSNVVALKLYEQKLGFVRSAYREHEYGVGEHRLVLVLTF